MNRRSFFASVALTCAGLLHARVAKWVPRRRDFDDLLLVTDVESARESVRAVFEAWNRLIAFYNTPLGVHDRMLALNAPEHPGEPDA